MAGTGVQVYLATPDPKEKALRFLEENEVSIPVILDSDIAVFQAYDLSEAPWTTAPYPLHVVIDAEGIVRVLSTESHLTEILEAIEGLRR